MTLLLDSERKMKNKFKKREKGHLSVTEKTISLSHLKIFIICGILILLSKKKKKKCILTSLMSFALNPLCTI